MNEASKAALQIMLNEKIKKREQIKEMAEQYEIRAKIIRTEEVIQLDEEIRQLQADLE